jgi:penicillin-insensitive murein endopeptidase
MRSQTGKALYAEHFVAFAGDGTAASWPGAYFDDAKNWALVSALVTDPFAHVSHIFVATPLRARLMAYAERMGVPLSVRVRASEVMAQPHGALPHDDHFHVRISCPSGMTGCVENPTAPKARFARVPVPHGRGSGRERRAERGAPSWAPHRLAHQHAKPPAPKPEPHTSATEPWAADDTPAAIMAAPLGIGAPVAGQRSATIPEAVDDVDGVLDH